jgi:hypothetical protein
MPEICYGGRSGYKKNIPIDAGMGRIYSSIFTKIMSFETTKNQN